MAFSIKNDDADRALRELTEITGESLTDAVLVSVRERLAREQHRRRHDQAGRQARVRRLVDEIRALPDLDDRTADEIIGYDELGLPG